MDSGLATAMESGRSIATHPGSTLAFVQVFTLRGETALPSYGDRYWKDCQGNDETFGKHKWDKQGACINTLSAECCSGYSSGELVDYFRITVDSFKTLEPYKFLQTDPGGLLVFIMPSSTKNYTSTAIQNALTAAHGFRVTI
ncbi:unnamed protein product, partial [Tuber aestivum]